MTKILILMLSAILLCSNAGSQTSPANLPDLSTEISIEAGVGHFGFSIETPLNKAMLFDAGIGLGAGRFVNVGAENFGYSFSLVSPVVQLFSGLRFYYDRGDRFAAGKNVSRNSGNFFGFRADYTSPSFMPDMEIKAWHVLGLNAHWGLHRQLTKRFSINALAGLGYAFNMEEADVYNSALYPVFELKLMYKLNR